MDTNVKAGPRAVRAAPQARTRRTRAAVIEAARRLFLERGYTATTIEAISELADTPQPTVYRLFSSKLGILKAVLDVSIAGDEEAVAMADRPQVRSLLANPDPRDTLTGFAALVGGLMVRTAPVHHVLEEAARSDRGAAAALAEIARQRHGGQRRITRSLARAGALRPELTERDAADIVHALASPEVYRLLVTSRGWSRERYQQWLASILIDQLLPATTKGERDETPRR
ncbi:MAG: TetR/AcrR family transcriptional regulator [Streptosporangiaceae bacterium]|nr:TetR/AcrR family transcriptional regulator [Streptosporangiaceae bacterium]